MKVHKAVIPAAGYGTRFLPATKSVPKMMLPVLDTPAVHLAVQEAVDAGIDQIVIVMSPHHDAIRAYFERAPELEDALRRQGKEDLLRRVAAIPDMAEITYVIQHQPLGLGHAVLLAREAVGDEPFAVFLPDDLIRDDRPTIEQLIEVFERFGGSVIAVKEVSDSAVPTKGIVRPVPLEERVYRVTELVEKPALAEAPSNLAIIGRYLLTPQVFNALEATEQGAIAEIQLTDGIESLLHTQEVFAYRFPGDYFDLGTPPGMLKASIHAALQREDVASDLREWLSSDLFSGC